MQRQMCYLYQGGTAAGAGPQGMLSITASEVPGEKDLKGFY